MRWLDRLHWPERLRPDWPAWRRRFSRVAFRLLAFNLILVFLPALGILSLEIYEKQLLDLQERSMVQQGRLLAAALEEAARVQRRGLWRDAAPQPPWEWRAERRHGER